MGADLLPRSILQQYDLRKDVWALLPPMPTPRYDANTHLLANKLYVAGGRHCKRPVKAFEVYDTEMRSWTTLPTMPCKRSYGGIIWDPDGRLCLLGGLRQGGGHQSSKFTKNVNIFDSNQGLEMKVSKVQMLQEQIILYPSLTFEEPDPALHRAPPISGEAEHAEASLFTHATFRALDTVEAFHPQKKKWESLAPMAFPRCSTSFIVIRERLLVVGGVNQVPSSANEILYIKEEEYL
ncbi:hypothetical protein fugu_005521 [Takifugu bimaculatus]|uniref:Kelch domain-containing protein n=1 Tax=Takifugu bimaculatus TaxID=433685 RepID=A0A4Z2BCX1_9TELE|nr:hypothetical protein fugu_005521 [Takifugu bimaculatus]